MVGVAAPPVHLGRGRPSWPRATHHLPGLRRLRKQTVNVYIHPFILVMALSVGCGIGMLLLMEMAEAAYRRLRRKL